jgi:tRNA U54 and U55 pseudouridine synthase Pus10
MSNSSISRLICEWIRTINSSEDIIRACRLEGFCGKCTLRYSLGRFSSTWSEWTGTVADESIHIALESFKTDSTLDKETGSTAASLPFINGDPWIPTVYNLCPSCSGALQGRGQALIYCLSTSLEGGSSSVIQNDGYGGGQGKISQDVIQMAAHRAHQEAEKIVRGVHLFDSNSKKKRRTDDHETEKLSSIVTNSTNLVIEKNNSDNKVQQWSESGQIGLMTHHIASCHWIDDIVQMITQGGYDLREGICISLLLQKGLFDAENEAYLRLCKRLGVLKLPSGYKCPDLKDLFRTCVTQAIERIVYDTRIETKNNSDILSSMDTVLSVVQSERVFEKVYKIQNDAAEISMSELLQETNNGNVLQPSKTPHMDKLIEQRGGICGDARALSMDVSIAVMLDRSFPLPSVTNVSSVAITVPQNERINNEPQIEATVDLNKTGVCLGSIETKTDHRQMFQTDSMGLSYIGGGDVFKTSTLRRLTSTPGLSSLQLNVAIDSTPRGFLKEISSVADAPVPHIAMVTTNVQRRSFFFKSRYCKYKRGLSQTPWFVDGTRKIGISSSIVAESGTSGGDMNSAVINTPFSKLGAVEINEETSVEELIGGPVSELVADFCGQGCAVGLLPVDTLPVSSSSYVNSTLPFGATVEFFNTREETASKTKKVLPRYKFHAAGREDVDVRMLGPGRPYMIELIDAKPSVIPLHCIARAHETLNQLASGRLMTFPLSPASRDESTRLSSGAESKKKSYSALVWTSMPHTKERLKELIDDKVHNLVVKQQTPIRVMHRRTLMTRSKKIHSAATQWISPHYFMLMITTSAGTYVKEFVHGDLGRTRPNIGELLSVGASPTVMTDKRPASTRVVADILLLDVTDLVMTSGNGEGDENDDDDDDDKGDESD